MDFGVWAQNGNMMTQAGQCQTDQGQNPPPPTPPNGGGSNSGDSGAAPLFSHQLEHPGVVCDACGNGVFGFRYKCLKCVDFDLCCNCERRGLHAGHIMMRIPFPEMAGEAIRGHMNNNESPEIRPPFPFGHYEHDHERCVGRPDHEHRPDHCRGRPHGRRRHSHSSPESSDETKPWCPYQMGRKEWKKWAKTFKKTAHVHKRSAEAYMKSPGACGTKTEPGTGAGVGATASGTSLNGAPFDFSVAASQIQEFLNAFGVPIDVVELYDEWGNRGAPTTTPQPPPQSAAAPSTSNDTRAQGDQAKNPETQETPQTAAMTEHFQELNIRSDDTPLDLSHETSVSGSTNLIQLNSTPGNLTPPEGDSEWTLVDDNESGAHTNAPDNTTTDGSAGPNGNSQEFATYISIPDETQVFRQIPIAIETPAAAVGMKFEATAVPSAPAPPNLQQRPIYPQLPHVPLVTPLMAGISNTFENVTRNIPPLPWAPPRPQQPQSIPALLRQQPPELNDHMTHILNQLLSMGFSNHNGDLSRLIYAKNGNMEDTLNALFPTSA